eukprot:gene8422-10341_t
MDEENLAKLLQAFSNCNYIEFVKIFSMIHGFDATFEFLRNALTTIPFMAFKRKFWMFGSSEEEQQQQQRNSLAAPISQTFEPSSNSTSPSPTGNPLKRQAIRSTWEDDSNDEFWNGYKTPKVYYDSDYDYHKNPNIVDSQKKKNNNYNINNIDKNKKFKSENQHQQQQQQQQQQHIQLKNNLKRKKSNQKRFIDLPFEVIIFIFSFLKCTDLPITSLVSKDWNRYSFVSTTELNIDNNRQLVSTEFVNKKIYKHSDYLRKLRCSQSKLFNNSSVRMVIEHCRNLMDVQLYHCQWIGDSEIELLASRLFKLTRIVLHSQNLTAKSLESLSQTKLQEIELGGFSKVPLEAFSKLAKITTLTSLDLSGISKDQSMCSSIVGCKQLVSLRLGVASESDIRKLPFLDTLASLSVAEWELDQLTTTITNPETQSITTIVPANKNDGSGLGFLEQCKSLIKLELTGAEDFIIRDFSSLVCCAETLKVLELDCAYSPYLEDDFHKIFPMLHRLEKLFISGFTLSGECWASFAKLPSLTHLSICCVKMNHHWINRGLEHLGTCEKLKRLSIINSTDQWINISEKSFSSLLRCRRHLMELRFGGSRGGGWVLNEGVFMSIGKLKVLQLLDLSNSRGVTEQCFAYLSQCPLLESLEGSISIDENTIRNTIAEWSGTGTLVNCPSLRKVSLDVKLPSFINSEITCPNSINRSFNLLAKLYD